MECCVQALSHLEPQSSPDSNNNNNNTPTNNDNNNNANEAASYLMNALRGLVNQQLQVRNGPDISPRYFDPKSKYKEKHETRRLQIEQSLFQTQTPDIYEKTNSNNNNNSSNVDVVRLKDGSTLRPLRHSDAPLINSQFNRQSSKSLSQITRCIHADNPACFGIFRGHELCGFILQYENGILGMLHVEEKHRRNGYGFTLVRKATELLERENRERVTFILDGNEASERIFARQGWIKADPTQTKGTGRRRAPRKWIKQSIL